MGILTVNITVSLGKLLTSYVFFGCRAIFSYVWDGHDRSSFFFEAFGHRRLRRLCSFGERLQTKCDCATPIVEEQMLLSHP